MTVEKEALTPMLSQKIPEIQANVSADIVNETVSDVMRRVYALMMLGLVVTSLVAWGVAGTDLLFTIASNTFLFFGIIIGQLALVVAVAAGAWRFPPHIAMTLFLVYAAINGIMFSSIFLTFSLESIASVFAITAVMFGLMSVLGFTTKTDLTKMGTFLFMGLIGVIVASVVNIFLQSSALYWIVSYLGVGIFLGLTAWDTQRIKRMTVMMLYSDQVQEETTISRIAISGALSLYLDFVNLFLFLLRIFGRN